MDVGEIAKAWYEKNEPEGALAQSILRAFFTGVLIKRPDFLLIAYPVKTDGHFILPGKPWNCWWLDFFTGPMEAEDLINQAPYPLEYFAFKRRRKIKIIVWKRLERKDDNGRCAVSASS